MRYLDETELARLNAEQWQVDLLKLNPSYLGWGPHEDYMCGDREGWSSRVINATWKDFGPWKVDDLNECVNFYFSVERADEECKTCGGEGYHPSAKPVTQTFYRHQCETVGVSPDQAWHDKITQDEADALIAAKRAPTGSTAETINAEQNMRRGFMGHDAINRGILIEARCKRLGLPLTCPSCEGHGRTFTAPNAHVSLTLWWLHPRKGCSRGIEVSRIERDELPSVFAFLRAAADRNAERFSRVSAAQNA